MKNIIISELDSSRIKQSVARGSAVNHFSANDINKLLSEIKKAKVVSPKRIPPDIVTMNSIVKITNLESNTSYTIQLVYPENADTKAKKISVFAPIATALLGYKKGDVVNWEVPQGNTRLRIDEIVYQPEAAGDYDL